MKLVTSSGDVTLDRAAWGGITASDPFPSLPVEFKGEYLALRFRFFYNPDPADFAGEHSTPPSRSPEYKPIPAYNPAPANLADTRPNPLTAPDPKTSFMPAVLMGYSARSMKPKYPKRALGAKIEGVVQLDAEIDSIGKVKNVKVLEGNPMLAEASSHAVRKWRFYAAQKEDKPSEDVVHIRVEFRLRGQEVRAQVVPPETPHPDSAH